MCSEIDAVWILGLFKNYVTQNFWTLTSCDSWSAHVVRVRIRGLSSILQEVFYKKGFLEISQNSQKNTCARVSFFNEVAGLSLKRGSGTDVFRWFLQNFLEYLSFFSSHFLFTSGGCFWGLQCVNVQKFCVT